MRSFISEILACASCFLFVSSNAISGSVFLALSVFFAMAQIGLENQAQKSKEKNVERVLQMLSDVGTCLDAFLRNVVITAASSSQHDCMHSHDDDDTNYN